MPMDRPETPTTAPQPKQASPEPEIATRDEATIRRDRFVEKVLANRNKVEPVYTPPPPPAQIAEQTRLEMAEGARRVALAAEAQKVRPAPKRDPSQGTTTPVYRPKDYVPNMKQGTDAILKPQTL
jgi:hypothetical protein